MHISFDHSGAWSGNSWKTRCQERRCCCQVKFPSHPSEISDTAFQVGLWQLWHLQGRRGGGRGEVGEVQMPHTQPAQTYRRPRWGEEGGEDDRLWPWSSLPCHCCPYPSHAPKIFCTFELDVSYVGDDEGDNRRGSHSPSPPPFECSKGFLEHWRQLSPLPYHYHPRGEDEGGEGDWLWPSPALPCFRSPNPSTMSKHLLPFQADVLLFADTGGEREGGNLPPSHQPCPFPDRFLEHWRQLSLLPDHFPAFLPSSQPTLHVWLLSRPFARGCTVDLCPLPLPLLPHHLLPHACLLSWLGVAQEGWHPTPPLQNL